MNMKVLLDSCFIISCVKRRIDFVQELKEMGFVVVVPREVLQELKDLKDKKRTSRETRTVIDVALELIEMNKVSKTSIGKGKVDEELIKKGKEGIFIATLDKGIKDNVPNKVFIISSKNSLGVQKD